MIKIQLVGCLSIRGNEHTLADLVCVIGKQMLDFPSSFNDRRIPKCNTVLQSENDLFEPKIELNSLNFEFSAFPTMKLSKCFRHCSVKGKAKAKPLL